MSKKIKLIGSFLILAVVMSLVVVGPAGAIQGTARVLDASLGDPITWTNQTATIYLEVKDADLNVPLKRILWPGDAITDLPGLQSATAGATTFTSDTAVTLAAGDLILFPGEERIKKVAAGVTAGTTVTVTTPFGGTHAGASASKVTNAAITWDNCADCTNAPTISTAANTNEQTFGLPNFPQLDINVSTAAANGGALANRISGAPDTALNKLDVAVVDSSGSPLANLNINSLDAANGVLKVQYSTVPGAGETGYVVYWTSVTDTAGVAEDPVSTSRVYVKSQADAGGIGVVVTETGASTGVFEQKLQLCATSGCSSDDAADVGTANYVPAIEVGANDVVTFSYNDASGSLASASVTVESDPTNFTNLAPAHNSATTSSLPIISGDVTDGASGVKKTSIRVNFNVAGTVTVLDPNVVVTGSVAAIPGGYAVQQRNPTAITDGDVLWWITANDVAGNLGVSDRVAASNLTGTVAIAGSTLVTGTSTKFETELVVGQTITVAGETRRVDAITSDTAVTVDIAFTTTLAGQPATKSTCVASRYNAINTPTATDCGGCDPYIVKVDNTVPDMVSAVTGVWWDTAKSITDKTETSPAKAKNTSVLVRFNEAIDPTTVQVTDFTVGGVQPIAAEPQADISSTPGGCPTGVTGCGVFLTTSALAPDAKPAVKLIGEVKDKAGNKLTIDEVTAADGIAPTITVNVVGTATSTRPVTNGPLTIQFSTDEAATVGTTSVIVKPIDTKTTLGGQVGIFTPTLVSARTWKVEYSASTAGVFNVYVTATDLSGNQGEKGHVSDPSNTNAILFEVDKAVPVPTFTPATTTDTTEPFISMDFATEGKEYGLKADGTTFTTDASLVVTSYDTHKTLTLTSATLDGVSILSQVVTEDNVIFLYKASGLALGDHTIKVKATDAAGTVSGEFSNTFTVTERAPFKLGLKPGMNLVSIPMDPLNSAINSVIPATAGVDLVVTYDPANPAGPWLTAQRNATTGLFEGTLATIDSRHGYWMRASSFVALEIDLPGQSTQALLPTVSVVKGWNLVPVIDLAQQAQGTAKVAATYFLNVGWNVAWTFNTLQNAWVGVPANTNVVLIGNAYWLWATAAGTITP